MERIVGRLNQLAEHSFLPTDDDEIRVRKRILTSAGVLTGIFLFGVGVLYIAFNEVFAGMLYAGFALHIGATLVICLFRWRNYRLTFWVIATPAMFLHLFVALSLGSFVNSGGIILWGLAFPVVTSILFVPFRWALPFWGLLLANLIITTVAQPYLRETTNMPTGVVMLIFVLNMITLSTFILGIFAFFVYQRDTAFRLLHAEQHKSEALLLNVLPQEIAAILKDDQRTIADHYESVSILFADVVGFTPLSASMSAVELVELLNDIFSHFDSLIEKYSLEKIKTIGDCYMVASGVPRPSADHAQRLVQMALEMQAYVAKNTFRGRSIEFRIGINSGDVVAGVIGRKKFIYDLWGDAVNTASRMESHGTGGSIQITEATHTLIKDDFVCEPRGTMTIKGKGDMAVWTVIAEK